MKTPRPNPRSSLLPALAALALLESAVALSGCSRPTAASEDAAAASAEAPPVPVHVEPVVVAPVGAALRRVGTVRAVTRLDVTTSVPGVVASVNAAEGDTFAAGDVLVEVDADELDARYSQVGAELDRARTERDLACRTADTDEELVRHGATTPVRADASRTSCLAAQDAVAAVEARRREVRAARAGAAWRAPVDGVVVRRLVEPGERATPGRPLLQVVGHDREIVVLTTQRDLDAGMAVGTPAALDTVTGRVGSQVAAVSPSAIGPGPLYEARIPIPSDVGLALRLGQLVDIEISLREPVEAPTVPNEALVWDGDLAFVVAVSTTDDVARLVPVDPGPTDGDRIAVTGGVAVGERVVVGPPEGISNGTRLYVVARETESP